MGEYVSVSSIELPSALKPYQEAIDLIWTDNMQEKDIPSIVSKLNEFVQDNILSKQFIEHMLIAALEAEVKNSHLVFSIASQVFNSVFIQRFLPYFQIKNPNPILWNDDVDALVTKDLFEADIAEAALYGAVKCFKVLIGKFSHFDNSLCKNAIIGGNLEIIRILDRHLNFATQDNVLVAIKNHRNNILDWIIEKDSSLSKIDSSICLGFMNYHGLISQFPRYNMMSMSLREMGLLEIYPTSFFNALFNLGLGVDFVYRDGFDVLNMLLSSVKTNNFEFVKFLVEKGADVNRVMSYNGGSTTTQDVSALKFAVGNDNVEIAKYLLDHGAKANIVYRTQGCFHYREESLLEIAHSQQMKDLLNVYMPKTCLRVIAGCFSRKSFEKF